jgi:hypothetical protein
VYRNGVMLGSADYTASNGLTVVLASGATAGDLVEVISFQVSSVLNAIPATAGSVGTTYLADASITSAKIASGQTLSLNGITFPATQVPSANANTLDDYEEGTWTPLCGDNSTPISTVQRATYIKIGKLVTVDLDCTPPSPNPGTNNYIYGLPFNGSLVSAGSGGGCVGYSNGGAVFGFHVTSNTNALYFWYPVTATAANIGGVRLIFSCSYTTSS